MAFRGLQAETAEHGQLHESVSVELHTLVADPFQGWTEGFKVHRRVPYTSLLINIPPRRDLRKLKYKRYKIGSLTSRRIVPLYVNFVGYTCDFAKRTAGRTPET